MALWSSVAANREWSHCSDGSSSSGDERYGRRRIWPGAALRGLGWLFQRPALLKGESQSDPSQNDLNSLEWTGPIGPPASPASEGAKQKDAEQENGFDVANFGCFAECRIPHICIRAAISHYPLLRFAKFLICSILAG